MRRDEYQREQLSPRGCEKLVKEDGKLRRQQKIEVYSSIKREQHTGKKSVMKERSKAGSSSNPDLEAKKPPKLKVITQRKKSSKVSSDNDQESLGIQARNSFWSPDSPINKIY